MNISNLLGLGLVLLFAGLMLLFAFLGRRYTWRGLRDIPAFSRLLRAIGLAVEDGTRVHLSIGTGNLTGPSSAAAFVGLSMLDRIVRVASESDHPPIATTGDGALAILIQSTLHNAYREMGTSESFDPDTGRLTGLTPFSYAAGVFPVIHDEMVSVNVLAGNFGSEVALISEAGDRSQSFTLAGTDSIAAQAILYAASDGPLVGEELYAGGAYLNAGLMHTASLHAQDVIRWLAVGVILIGAALEFLGIGVEGLLP